MGAILQQSKTQFFDGNGNPLAGGLVYYYAQGTTTYKNTYQDSGLTVLNTNPVVLDAAGLASIWGNGAYTMKLTDALGNQIYQGDTGTAAYDPSAVAITGGTIAGVAVTTSTIDSSPVGAVTPSTGAFTTLAASGMTALSGGLTLSGETVLPTIAPTLTTGTATAYVAALTPAPPALAAGMSILVNLHVTSGAAPTISIDGGTTNKAINVNTGGVITAPVAGSLLIGRNVGLVYDGTQWVIGGQQWATNTDALAGTAYGLMMDPVGVAAAIAAIPVPPAGGMTFLGTLTTTSGTTQTLSSLDLTSYKMLWITVKQVTMTAAAALAIQSNTNVISGTLASSAKTMVGTVLIDLSSGIATGMVGLDAAPGGGPGGSYGKVTTYSTASTSISFLTSTGSFSGGSISFYGVA